MIALFFFDSCDSAIEIVSLDRLTLIRRFSIGERAVTSLAVSPGGRQLYVTDSLNKEVAIFDVLSGRLVASVPVPGFILRDSVLSAGGKTLYVTVDNSIIAINTITNTIQQTLMTGADITLGIAISPDGNTLGAVSTDGGTKPALYLVDPGTLMLKARVPITNPGESTNCATIPLDIAFSDTGLALLWDSNCDNLYQVDVASKTQLTAGTIRMGRDNSSFFNFNNMLYYSPVSNRAYALKESQELAVMAPVGVSGFLVGGFDGVPFVPTLTPDGGRLFISVIHRFAGGGGGADTLDQYNTASETFTRNVYSFSFPNMFVRDMRVVLSPALEAISAVSELIEEVQAVVTTGAGNALIAVLEAVQQQLGLGHVNAAIQLLQTFITQVNVLIRTGALAPEEAQALIDAASDIISQLGG